MPKTIVFLINVGTPLKPERRHVRKYLTEFLNDKRVIDLPWLLRKILVNLIIIPFRASKSTALYKRLWTSKGSPLLINTVSLAEKLNVKLGDEFQVIPVMNYGQPRLIESLRKFEIQTAGKIIFFPLFPQYASSTTGSTIEAVMRELKSMEVIPDIRFINQFYNHPAYLNAFIEVAKKYDPSEFDHIIFSYHGLPLRQIRKIHPDVNTENCECKTSMSEHGRYCYRATCYETTRLLASKMNLDKSQYTVTFQSRLSNDWLSPFTDETLKKLAKEGKKKILLFAPSFVSDCLETLIELKEEGNEIFKAAGGEELVVVESLNDEDVWVEAVGTIILTGA